MVRKNFHGYSATKLVLELLFIVPGIVQLQREVKKRNKETRNVIHTKNSAVFMKERRGAVEGIKRDKAGRDQQLEASWIGKCIEVLRRCR